MENRFCGGGNFDLFFCIEIAWMYGLCKDVEFKKSSDVRAHQVAAVMTESWNYTQRYYVLYYK